MAQANISHTWADGSEVEFQIYVEGEFPDAIDEARAAVTRMYRELVTDDAEADDVPAE